MLYEYWQRNFAHEQPLAHELRERYRKRWVRFHSLPNSKRYPETDNEWATLLERHNLVVDHLATDGCQLELLTTNWSAEQNSCHAPSEILQLGLAADHWQSFTVGDPANWWHMYRSSVIWSLGSLDCVFRLVADHAISNVMILDPDKDWLLHPYDGGLDVIHETRQDRNVICSAFGKWRPRGTGGL